jgi:uncharacterized membrane protein YfcA
MDPYLILFLAVINFFTAFFGVITGGANLIITPLLISLGVPAPSAVAATRVGNLGTGSVSLFKFHRGGKVLWRVGLPLVVVAISASFIAANIVLTINEVLLQRLIGIVILGILFIFIINKKFGLEERRKSAGGISKLAGFSLYFFAILVGSIVGGGTGVLGTYILIFFFGLTFLQSSGTRKIAGMASIITGSVVYIAAGVVPYDIVLALLVSGTLGGWAGTHYAIKKGEGWARLLFFIVIFALGLKLLIF